MCAWVSACFIRQLHRSRTRTSWYALRVIRGLIQKRIIVAIWYTQFCLTWGYVHLGATCFFTNMSNFINIIIWVVALSHAPLELRRGVPFVVVRPGGLADELGRVPGVQRVLTRLARLLALAAVQVRVLVRTPLWIAMIAVKFLYVRRAHRIVTFVISGVTRYICKISFHAIYLTITVINKRVLYRTMAVTYFIFWLVRSIAWTIR